MSKIATIIAKKGLGVKQKDPMSGFFAFKRNILNGFLSKEQKYQKKKRCLNFQIIKNYMY